jgi:hypothetical protein
MADRVIEFPTKSDDNFPGSRGGPVVTESPLVFNIWGVSPRTPQMLTKRRAVDFCLVQTAICCVVSSAAA